MAGPQMPRVDAVAKVRGAARFVADLPLPPDRLHAAWVGSEVARGRVRSVDREGARRMPGVRHVITHAEMPRLSPPPQAGKPSWFGEVTAPMQGDQVVYVGQPVALVLAESQAEADHAARALRIKYDAVRPEVGLDGPAVRRAIFSSDYQLQVTRGNPGAAIAASAARVSGEYHTPANHHAPIETPAAVASWRGDRLDLWITSRGVVDMREIVAHAFGLPEENVTVTCRYVGGAFGAKGWQFDHAMLTAAAARIAGRPVRLVLTREQMFRSQGRRPETRQRVTVGAAQDGTIRGLTHDTRTQTSRLSPYFTERAGDKTMHMYAAPALAVSHDLVAADVSSPVPTRAPGGAPGSFALETALDEAAVALGMDPVAFRVRNLPRAGDPDCGKPWTTFHAEECWKRAAELFRWSERNPRPRATRDGDEWVGWGCAAAGYTAQRRPASASATLLRDGTIEIRVASHDAGHGTYTALTIVAAERLGVPAERIRVLLGDARYPEAPTSGGSTTLATTGPATMVPCDALKRKLAALAVADRRSAVAGLAAEAVKVAGGRIASDTGRTENWTAPLRRARLDRVAGTAKAEAGDAEKKYGTYSFGAHFVEARVHAALGRVRVTRYVGVIDPGRVLAPAQARSQIMGGMMFALGQALTEHGLSDASGRLATHDLGGYHVPCCADAPAEFTVEFLDRPDTLFAPTGTRGIGELGTVGLAGAVGNAVYHATGKRVRELPLTPEKLL